MAGLEVLEYLEKKGPTNTFRLATELGINRYNLLNIINRLEAKGALTIKSGTVYFIKFLPKEKKEAPKKVLKTKKKTSTIKKPRKTTKTKVLQNENNRLKEKLIELEETIKKLEKKDSIPPKIITRTITRKIPVIKTVIKKIHVPFPTKKKKKIKKRQKIKTKKFKFLPKFNFMNGIKKLKKPEFT